MTIVKQSSLAMMILAGACASSGLNNAVRGDVEARMSSARPALRTCYQQALERDGKAQGTVVVSFVARRGSGKFGEVKVVRSDIFDADLQQCVVERVGTLALEKPVKDNVAVEYPLAFSTQD